MEITQKMKMLTDKAVAMLRRQGAGEDKFLRITVISGGCAGMTYDAEIDATMRDTDSVVRQEDGITIVTNKESIKFLEGLQIDYSDDLISAGYRFSNGNSDSSCGCGASFTLSGFPALSGEGVTCGS